MFKFTMTDELTMAKADEDAQIVYAKKLAADIEKVRKESVPRNYQSNAKADLLLKEKVKKEGVPRNHKNSKKSGLLLIKKVRKESVPRNHKNSKKSGLLLIEKVRKESVLRAFLSPLKESFGW